MFAHAMKRYDVQRERLAHLRKPHYKIDFNDSHRAALKRKSERVQHFRNEKQRVGSRAARRTSKFRSTTLPTAERDTEHSKSLAEARTTASSCCTAAQALANQSALCQDSWSWLHLPLDATAEHVSKLALYATTFALSPSLGKLQVVVLVFSRTRGVMRIEVAQ